MKKKTAESVSARKTYEAIPRGTCVLKNRKGNLVMCEDIYIPSVNFAERRYGLDISQVRARIVTRKGKRKEVNGLYFDRDDLMAMAILIA